MDNATLGTLLFYILGALIVIAAALVIIANKK